VTFARRIEILKQKSIFTRISGAATIMFILVEESSYEN
ncbi:unnamed protein product, partial [marine sediment metagenome]